MGSNIFHSDDWAMPWGNVGHPFGHSRVPVGYSGAPVGHSGVEPGVGGGTPDRQMMEFCESCKEP